MKKIFLSLVTGCVILVACTNNNQSKEITTNSDTTVTANEEDRRPASIEGMLTGYLQIKNALVKDNGQEAAVGGKEISNAMEDINASAFTVEQKQAYDDVKDDMKEHAEHINKNSDKIDHQREHFEMLSNGLYDLVKRFNPEKTLYKDHCPMFNDGKGAIWLSEIKEIKNPYYGKKMITCGSVKEEIK